MPPPEPTLPPEPTPPPKPRATRKPKAAPPPEIALLAPTPEEPDPVATAEAPSEPTAEPSTEPKSVEVSRFTTEYVPPPPKPEFKKRRRLTPEEAEVERQRRAVRRRRRRNVGFVLLGIGGLILFAGAWVTWRTYQAYSHLQVASDQVSQLQAEIKDVTSIDLKATDETVANLQAESAKAQSAVSDPFYRAATVLPWVGPNLHAISEVTATVDSLSIDVVPSLVQIAKTLNPSELAPKDGVIKLAPIEAASPLLQKADSAVNASRIRLAAIDRSAVVEQVNGAVLTLWSKLDQASSITATGARVARLLPPMLGAGGPRTYLVAFQNLAELRATGGIFGSFAVVRVADGKISIIDRGRASRSIGFFNPPIEQLDPKITDLYSDLMGVYPQDVNFTPDFPTAAGLFAKMYTARKGTAIDGVLATDPVALSYALKGIGPIDVGEGVTLTSQNIVTTLLSSAYAMFENDADQAVRDGFLANATTTAFQKVMAGSGNAHALMSGLTQAARERRVLIWSADDGEQADISQTTLAGTLSEAVQNPTIGVFLNDGTGAKLDFYLTNSVAVTPGSCQADGRRQLHVAVTMRYTAPPAGLPAEVVGDGQAAGQKYVLQTRVLLFAPVGGGVVDVSQDKKTVGVMRGDDRGREVGQVIVRLPPGDTTVLDFTVLAPVNAEAVGQDVVPALVLTPGVHPWTTSIAPYQGCGTSG